LRRLQDGSDIQAGKTSNDHPLELIVAKLEKVEAELVELRRENTALRQRFDALPPPRDEATDLRRRLDYALWELARRDELGQVTSRPLWRFWAA
jgi:hypothetical protein